MRYHILSDMTFLTAILFGCLAFFGAIESYGQFTIQGEVKAYDGKPLSDILVAAPEHTTNTTFTNDQGVFRLKLPEEPNHLVLMLQSLFEGDTTWEWNGVTALDAISITYGENTANIDTVVIEGDQGEKGVTDVSTTIIDIGSKLSLPNPFPDISDFLRGELGFSKNNELSTAYSIRGGNFDENLVYVNDFEVYRPFLIRSGQQEGLSFVNVDMVREVSFSAGGFAPKYGDKMASVLDVTYNRPNSFRSSAETSLLGGSLMVQDVGLNHRLAWSVGIRHKNSQYLLGSTNTNGQYSPSFTDVQYYVSALLQPKWRLEWIGQYARNRFYFVPTDRVTDFGLFNQQNRFQVYYSGQENDRYQNVMNGLALIYNPQPRLNMKWMLSHYAMRENESFDLIGDYLLGEVETDPSQSNVGEIRLSLGSGTFHDWARNQLNTEIFSTAYRGNAYWANHTLRWGITYKNENIQDRLSEWGRQDSVGYSLPYSADSVLLYSQLRSTVDISSHRLTAFVQHRWEGKGRAKPSFLMGCRGQWWSINKELVVSPRAQFQLQPTLRKDSLGRTLKISWAAGLYAQPPFYREMRNLQGVVNTDLLAQKSVHAIWGLDYRFKAWDNRDFAFTTEAYYKYMWDLVPYEFDNVLIRYFGENKARGYTAGLDLRLAGQLAEGLESWVTLGYMHAREDIEGDNYTGINYYKEYVEEDGVIVEDIIVADTSTVYPGFIPRPTDRRVSFSLSFQDYIPRYPFFRVQMNLVVATGLPFGPPDGERYNDVFRISTYKRFDIGFSARLYDRDQRIKKRGIAKKAIKNAWLSLEVLNLFGIENAVSYLWVRGLDVRNGGLGQFAVPNYLTNRRVNLRFRIDF